MSRWQNLKTAVNMIRIAGLLLYACGSAWGQPLPSEPIALGNGLLTIGGDLSASVGPTDDGFFNFTDYEHSALRMVRIDVSAALRAGKRVSFLGELRTENFASPEVYAMYVRIRPWIDRRVDVQIGRIPPTFGAFARRSYPTDNPLIGYPLAYQYLTSLRTDALPATNDELLRMRGRGWLSSFSVGNTAPNRGVPLASAFRWDTGVEVHGATDWLDASGAVTAGTLSDPRLSDDRSGPQLSGRLALHPVAGLILGGSVARGPFVSQAARRAALGEASNEAFSQTAWGSDIEYSRGYYLIRFETVHSRWDLPIVGAPGTKVPLRAAAASVEARYKIRPGLYAAARVDHLGFSEVVAANGVSQTWDAPVDRVELGGGYTIQRNLLLKLEYQYNTRDGGRVHQLHFGAAQVVFWF